MKDKIITVNDVLSTEDFEKLRNRIMDKSFPWYYYDYVVGDAMAKPGTSEYQQQFVHQFQEFSKIVTQGENWEILMPIFAVLDPINFVRIKANLIPKADKVVVHGYHIDTIHPCSLTAIFYVNTNNGYTEFKNGVQTPSVANSMVIFPSYLNHSGSTCTDEKVRIAININFVPIPDSKYSYLSIPEEICKLTRDWQTDGY